MTSTTQDTDAKPAKTFGQEVGETVKTIVYALLIALVLRVAFFEPFTIPSASMEPGLLTGDYVIVSKWDYGWSRYSIPFNPPLFHGRVFEHEAHRGDVVVFKLPRDPNVTYVKRLIGLPGDRIRVRGGSLFINGQPVRQTDLGPAVDPDPPNVTVEQVRETMPSGKSYVTFDRGPGHDGDDTDDYVVPQGYYFMMGDNRDNSLDSRWPTAIGVGFVPAENLVGKARLVMVSWKGGASILKPWTWVRIDPTRFFKPVS